MWCTRTCDIPRQAVQPEAEKHLYDLIWRLKNNVIDKMKSYAAAYRLTLGTTSLNVLVTTIALRRTAGPRNRFVRAITQFRPRDSI